MRQTEFFLILGHFLPFYLPNGPENQNFEKIQKTPGDIMILHLHIINDIMYHSWDMECNRHNFLFWTIFCPLTSLTSWKITILKKWKKCLEKLSFQKSVPKMTITWCMIPEIWSATDILFRHLRAFFALLQPKRSKFWKNEKSTWRYYFMHDYHK